MSPPFSQNSRISHPNHYFTLKDTFNQIFVLDSIFIVFNVYYLSSTNNILFKLHKKRGCLEINDSFLK